jgi:hypothetical protein
LDVKKIKKNSKLNICKKNRTPTKIFSVPAYVPMYAHMQSFAEGHCATVTHLCTSWPDRFPYPLAGAFGRRRTGEFLAPFRRFLAPNSNSGRRRTGDFFGAKFKLGAPKNKRLFGAKFKFGTAKNGRLYLAPNSNSEHNHQKKNVSLFTSRQLRRHSLLFSRVKEGELALNAKQIKRSACCSLALKLALFYLPSVPLSFCAFLQTLFTKDLADGARLKADGALTRVARLFPVEHTKAGNNLPKWPQSTQMVI